MAEAIVAAPAYDVGDVVRYRDRQNRLQTGAINRVDAHWGWGAGRPPLLIFSVYHPTYRNNHMYAGVDDILGAAS